MESGVKKSLRGKLPNGEPNPIDIHIGKRIYSCRRMRGFSQEQLAAKLDLVFQQVQKYEKGVNRVSASRLWEFSKILCVPISFFYEGIDDKIIPASLGNLGGRTISEALRDKEYTSMTKKEAILLAKAYAKLVNLQVQKQAFDLMKAMLL